MNLSWVEIFVRHLLKRNPSVKAAAKILVFAKVRKNLSTKGAAAKNDYPAAIKTKDPRQQLVIWLLTLRSKKADMDSPRMSKAKPRNEITFMSSMRRC